MTSQWKVRVNQGACIASGICAATAPDHFAFNDEQRSYAVNEMINPDEAVRTAAVSCPVEAISLFEADTGKAVPPPL